MRLTITEVAQMAGVSTATVSRVLNGSRHVSPETRARVMEIVKSSGYRPSLVARGLAKRKVNIFALICCDIANLFYPELARGVQDEANAHGYHVIMCNTDDDPAKENAILETLEQLPVAGVVHASVLLDHTDGIERMVKAGIPCVLVNRRLRDTPVDYVVPDNVTGAFLAVEHLIARGHTRIGYVGGPDNASNSIERREGYKLALKRHGIPFDENLVRRTNYKPPDAYRAARELLSQSPRPTALFVQNDYLCISVIDAILEAGLTVPEDIALVSFDGTSIANSRLLQLSTVSQKTYAMGRRAAEILIKKAQNPDIKERYQIVFEPELIVRRSSGGFLNTGDDQADEAVSR